MNLWLYALMALFFIYVIMRITAAVRTEPDSIDDSNPYLHPDFCAATVPDSALKKNSEACKKDIELRTEGEKERKDAEIIGVRRGTIYEKVLKRMLDEILSFFGLLLLSPIFLAIVMWIKIDDPGPAFFTQKRVGQGKHFFRLHKFRSMKMSTPHDIPTHMLENPEQYITKVGLFIRRSSLDEIPQMWDIFRGKMSIIGPRPALWNQEDLVAEREKYGANNPKPGLTGWAQINGRDEIEIPVKARLDGDYTAKLHEGGMKAFLFDFRCFVGTIFSVARAEGVLEGGTGEMNRRGQYKENKQN